jgi:hypothetical protein
VSALCLHVAGIGLWSPQLADTAALRDWLAGTVPASAPRPAAAYLPAQERRRASAHVLLAAEVAGQAIAMSTLEPAALTCVFSSAHGDQAITDYLCTTLAQAPQELSPTRFHNSVHNAAAGYWTIATGCRAPSSAICAAQASVGAGLLEAASQALADQRPVLLVCSDVAGQGPLAQLTACTRPFAAALVLTAEPGHHSLATVRMQLQPNAPCAPLIDPLLPEDWLQGNPAAAALPLLVALLNGRGRCILTATVGLQLSIDVEPPA